MFQFVTLNRWKQQKKNCFWLSCFSQFKKKQQQQKKNAKNTSQHFPELQDTSLIYEHVVLTTPKSLLAALIGVATYKWSIYIRVFCLPSTSSRIMRVRHTFRTHLRKAIHNFKSSTWILHNYEVKYQLETQHCFPSALENATIFVTWHLFQELSALDWEHLFS